MKKQPIPTPTPKTLGIERFTVRLQPDEMDEVNEIIIQAIHDTRERITMTDVMRIGVKRIKASGPLSAAEIAALRATDSRRAKK